MATRFNPFTGNLDLIGSGTGDVVGPAASTDLAIARYDGVTGKLIQDSKTTLQDGGAIQAQGFLTWRLIQDTVTVPSDYSMLASSISIEDGELIIEGDGEVIIL